MVVVAKLRTADRGAEPGESGTRVVAAQHDDPVLEAKVLVALGELTEAEHLVTRRLDEVADDLTALNLFAKIKHLKGEISQAVACWARLHASSPHHERGLMRLASVLELARNPERHAADFMALAPPQLAGIVELEAAFRQLLARRPVEAKTICGQLAAKHRGSHRELYKLCVLAKAWVAELSGDLHGACTTLEELGAERGFETDTDRVLGLARLYERLGDRAHLEKAVHVHRWLDRSFEKISAQSRLAALHRKLGNEGEAERYDDGFRDAFERRMHRPSRAEVARIAAGRFLPLDRLSAVKVSSDLSAASLDPAAPRQRAIFDFLSGDVVGARVGFEHAGELLDRKYLASLRALTGDLDGSVDLMLGALQADPLDARAACHVLIGGEPARITQVGGDLAERVREGLLLALAGEPRRAQLWRALGKLLDAQGKDAEAAIHRSRADALDDAHARDAEPVGRVLAAAVYRFVGKSKGLIHQIWADRKPAVPGRGGFLHREDVLGNLTPEMRQGVSNTFFAVREYARSRFPHRTADILDYDYTYKVTKEDEPSGGLSAGVPTALAFLSVFLQQPIPQDLASTGVVIADSHEVLVVRSVGDADYKLKAAYHRNLRVLILPFENREELLRSREVPRAATEELGRFVSNIDEAISIAFGDRVWTD